jgi:hypothetical protein
MDIGSSGSWEKLGVLFIETKGSNKNEGGSKVILSHPLLSYVSEYSFINA